MCHKKLQKVQIIFFMMQYLNLSGKSEFQNNPLDPPPKTLASKENLSYDDDQTQGKLLDGLEKNEYENYNDETNFNFCEDLDFNCSESDVKEVGKSIKNLEISGKTANSLTLSWTYKKENETIYTIKWFEGKILIGTATTNASSQMYEITNLDPCTEYKITFIANDFNEKEKYIFGNTTLIQPGAPTNLVAVPYDRSRRLHDSVNLKVSWKEPIVGKKCIQHYSIDLSSDLSNCEKLINGEKTNNTSTIISDLCPCTSYRVEVKAIDRDNGSGLIAQVQSKPTKPKVSRPPRFVAVETTQNTMALTWNVRDPRNNCSVLTINTFCEAVSSGGWGFNITKSFWILNIKFPEGYRDHEYISTLKELYPYHTHSCSSRIKNEAGWSYESTEVYANTKEAEPSPPENFTVDEKKLIFKWDHPSYVPGKLKNYFIHLNWTALYPTPDSCSKTHQKSNRRNTSITIDPSETNYTWTNWEGFSSYTAYMKAQTKGGFSRETSVKNFTIHNARASSSVTNLQHKTRQNGTSTLDTILSWNLPCSLQGKLKEFEIFVVGLNNVNPKEIKYHNFSLTLVVQSELDGNENFSINLGELRSSYFYTYNVSAITADDSGKKFRGDNATLKDIYNPPGIPPEPTKDYIKSITLNPDKVLRTLKSFTILLPLFKNDNGTIEYYAILVSRKGCSKKSRARFDLSSENWPNISTWKESKEHDFKITYQATEPYWTPFPNQILDYGSVRAAKFTIGDDNDCIEMHSKTSNVKLYCNGPLKPDTWYEVRMRGFTDGGYADSEPFLVKTKSETSVILIVIIVAGILFLGIMTALLLNQKFNREKKKSNSNESNNKQHYYRNRRTTMNVHPHIYAQTFPVKSKRRYE